MLDIYEGSKQSNTKAHSNEVYDWEHALSRATGSSLSLGRERHEQLLREAELDHLISGLTKGNSESGRAFLDIGALFVKLGCRLEKLGFGRLSLQQVNAGAAVDCSCA